MRIEFPSREFDDALAAICHGVATGDQVRALNELLRHNAAARDEYIVRIELHSRLASDPDLFPSANELPVEIESKGRNDILAWGLALAACIALTLLGWRLAGRSGSAPMATTSLNAKRNVTDSAPSVDLSAPVNYEHWRAATDRLNADPTLVAHFDFENRSEPTSLLRNGIAGAAIEGCRRNQGRWAEKTALEFAGVEDRVRLNVPGEFEELSVAAWVRVDGLKRELNSLLMSDGFGAGTIHWMIRRDGALGVTVIGARPGDYQIAVSASVVTPETFGAWMHLAVVLDGPNHRVQQFVNGCSVAEKRLRIDPPFRIGPAQLGNWNAHGFPENDPFMIRNFTGAMDEVCVFSRALDTAEIKALYSAGKPGFDRDARN